MNLNNLINRIIHSEKSVIPLWICLPVFILLMWMFVGCGGAKRGDIPTASENLHRAIALYENEDYLDAQEEFSAITMNYPGSVVVDSAEFYLGETHFALREYLLAAASYERVITQYPRSVLVPLSQFNIGVCYYRLSPIYALDQEFTIKAIMELQKFLEDYPDDEHRAQAEEYLFLCRQKLAKKEYTAGILYLRLMEYDSAIIYFDEILNNYYDTKYAPLALFYKGEAYFKDRKTSQAQTTYDLFLSKYPDHVYLERATERLKEIDTPEPEEESYE